MKAYRFEVQAHCEVVVMAESKDEARMQLIDSDDLYYEELLEDPYVSDGDELKKESEELGY
jgi:hypothetical protein